LLIAAAFALIKPGISTDLLGAALIGTAVVAQLVLGKAQPAVAEPGAE
jgi:UPF0716 family protein affecting phage T7 exclusion